jgi:ATP/maltotriose-dependent transcriptional regulator MalT
MFTLIRREWYTMSVLSTLTIREREVLKLIAANLSATYTEIGEALIIHLLCLRVLMAQNLFEIFIVSFLNRVPVS